MRPTLSYGSRVLLLIATLLGGCAAPSSLVVPTTPHGATGSEPSSVVAKVPAESLEPAGIRVLNHTRHSLIFQANGQVLGNLESGGDTVWTDIPTGPVRVEAHSEDGSRQFATTLHVRPGHVPYWHVERERCTAELVNLTGESVRIVLGDHHVENLPPGERATLADLLPGVLTCTAQGLTSQRSQEAVLTLEPGAITRWFITQEASTALIHNPTSETMQVRVNDAAPLSLVPGGRITIQGLLPGPTRFHAEGETSRARTQVKLNLEEGEIVHWDARLEAVELVIYNESSETLKPAAFLGLHHSTIPPASERRFPLPSGPRTLSMTGVTTGTLHTQDLALDPATRVEWRIPEPTGSLLVRNHRNERIQIQLGERSHALIDAQQDALIGPLPIGTMTLEALGLTSQWHQSQQVDVQATTPLSWTLRHKPAALRVFNETPETVNVYIEGVLHGSLLPNQTGDFGPIHVGASAQSSRFHRATAIGLTSRTWHEVDVTSQEGQTASWHLHLPDSRVRVHNRRQDDASLRIPGRPPVLVPPGSKVDALIPTRPQTLRFRNSEGTHRARVHPRPGQTHSVELLPSAGTIVVDNITSHPLEITWGGLSLGVVQGATRALLPDLPIQAITLVASNPELPETWQLRHRIVPEAILYWRIDHPGSDPTE